MGNSAFFRSSSNFPGNWRILRRGVKICMPWNTAVPECHHHHHRHHHHHHHHWWFVLRRLSLMVCSCAQCCHVWSSCVWLLRPRVGFGAHVCYHCRISPPRFLAECRKRRLNQGSFVLLFFRLFTLSDLYLVFACLFSCTALFVSINQVIRCEDRLRNDL